METSKIGEKSLLLSQNSIGEQIKELEENQQKRKDEYCKLVSEHNEIKMHYSNLKDKLQQKTAQCVQLGTDVQNQKNLLDQMHQQVETCELQLQQLSNNSQALLRSSMTDSKISQLNESVRQSQVDFQVMQLTNEVIQVSQQIQVEKIQ
ncbi:Hypothetical_protein [Hexamita inflata]|uniref:Hypothetical_protein n=1 Tax=Hexamita inflata TaxID=28002 RepID=A0ABP1GYY6_9EUKA